MTWHVVMVRYHGPREHSRYLRREDAEAMAARLERDVGRLAWVVEVTE